MDETAANPILAGALVGGLYSGAQTAINGGSFSEVLKAAAIGAVTGAIGGAIGGPLGEVAGEVSGALGGGVAGEVAGAVVHAVAHGVVGGGMSAALGGTFQDGFIGSAIGAGVTSALGAMPGMSVLEGRGVLKVIGRTAVAAISGGAASVLAGGKFADGAYSAAFFHLFNSEVHRVTETQQGLELGNPLAHPEFSVDSSGYEYSYYSTRTEYNFITQETTVTHYYQHHGSTESFTPLDVLGMFRGIGAGVARGMRGLFAAKSIPTQGPVIVGETMARVEAAAAKIPGAKILNDMTQFTGAPHQVTSQMMQYNRKWILDQMRSGRPIIDIGRDAGRTNPSIFYQMEQNMLKNYKKLHPGSLNVMWP